MLVRAGERQIEPVRHRNGPLKEVLLRSGVVPDVTQVATAAFREASEIGLHEHPTMYEIFFVLEGRAAYTVGQERYEVAAGDLVVVPPGVPHGICVTAPPHRIIYWGVATCPTP